MSATHPDPSEGRAPFGVYVHMPFCRHRCDYCAFATYTDRDHLMEAYAAACVTELHRAVEREGLPAATSVFVGGGTPSRLPADLLVSVLGAVPRAPGAATAVPAWACRAPGWSISCYSEGLPKDYRRTAIAEIAVPARKPGPGNRETADGVSP